MLNVGTILVGKDHVNIGSSAHVVKVLNNKSTLLWKIGEKELYPPMTYSNISIMKWIECGIFYLQSTKRLEEYM